MALPPVFSFLRPCSAYIHWLERSPDEQTEMYLDNFDVWVKCCDDMLSNCCFLSIKSILCKAAVSLETKLKFATFSQKGFKTVGDNIDKNLCRSFQRIDYQTRSFHYFHSYAVLETASDLPKPGVVDLMQVLPTETIIFHSCFKVQC